jgi:F-box-like
MLLPSPNATQNRVPAPHELATLRSIAKSNAELSDSIQTRILRAREAYEGAMEQYRAQQLVLESLLSEVHMAKQFLGVLEAQKRVLDEEMPELRALIHPIRRCPSEVLSNIFAMTTTPLSLGESYRSHREHLNQTYNILRVCRHWRDVALQCPPLWAVIPISLRDSLADIKKCWERSVKRVKRSPASVCLLIPGCPSTKNKAFRTRRQQYKDAFEICDLSQIPVIYNLRLEPSDFTGVTQALSLMTHFPSGRLKSLEISGFWDMETSVLEWWSWTTFLQRFPPFTHLEIQGASNFTVDKAPIFPTVKHIYLENHQTCGFSDLLLACPNLESLDLDSVSGLTMGPASPYHLPKLTHLSLKCIYGFPWQEITAPNLTSFHVKGDHGDGDIDDQCAEFLSTCQKLTSVELAMVWDSLLPLARATDILMHLSLELHETMLEPFLHWEESGLAAPPFTNLKTLSLFYPDPEDESDYDVPALLYFDELVTKRCLPLSNPASRLASPLRPLEGLFIKHNTALPLTWAYSVHCPTAMTRIFKLTGGHVSATLSWVLNKEALREC